MKRAKQKKGFLIYKVDINNTNFDRMLLGIKSGHYYDDSNEVFSFNLDEISINTFAAGIKRLTKTSDHAIIVYETTNGKYAIKKVR